MQITEKASPESGLKEITPAQALVLNAATVLFTVILGVEETVKQLRMR